MAKLPVLLVITKIDLLQDKAEILPIIQHYQPWHDFAACIPVSATRRDGLEVLESEIVTRLPAGPHTSPKIT